MRARLLPALLVPMLALPASAAELGLILDKQFGKAQTVAAGITPGSTLAGKIDAIGPTGVGIRAGISILDLKVAELGVTATYHPKAEGDVEVSGTKYGKLGTEYIAVGAQVDWKFLVNIHAGVDLRREKYTLSDFEGLNAGLNGDNTVTRPWIKAGIGFSVPTPLVSPFFRLEVAMATKKESAKDSEDNLRKALAPEYQIGLYGGIRF